MVQKTVLSFPGLERLDEFYGFSAGGVPSDPILFNSVSNSIGSGNTMVVFFSTPISVSVCR